MIIGLIIGYAIAANNLFIYGALLIGGVAVVSDKFAKKMAIGWMKLAEVLGLIFPPIILGVIYIIILIPLSILAKMGRKENAVILKEKQKTMFKEVNKTFKRESFEKMW